MKAKGREKGRRWEQRSLSRRARCATANGHCCGGVRASGCGGGVRASKSKTRDRDRDRDKQSQSVLLAWALVEYIVAWGDRANSKLRCCMCAIFLLRSCE